MPCSDEVTEEKVFPISSFTSLVSPRWEINSNPGSMDGDGDGDDGAAATDCTSFLKEPFQDEKVVT